MKRAAQAIVPLLAVPLLLLAARTAHAASSPGPSRVLVVYNNTWTGDEDGDGTQDSLQVAQYYMAKRGIPAENVLALDISGTNWSGDYESTDYAKLQSQMIQPIKTKLAALGPTNIDIILLSYHLPVGFKGYSIDNLLMGLNYWNPTTDDVSWSSNPYLEANPTFSPDKGNFSHASYKFGGTEMYLVTRLDGPLGPIGCANMVDQAIYADKYLAPGAGYYNGNVYIDSRGDKGASVYTDANLSIDTDVVNGWYGSYAQTDVNIAYGEHYVLPSGFTLKWQNVGGIIGSAGLTYTDTSSAELAPRAFLYGGWYAYNTYLDVYEWLPGSVACDLDSSSLCYYWFRDPALPDWAGQALYHGATCVQGVAGEPYTTGHQRPNIMVWAMLSGFNFAEAAALSTPSIGWMPINLGDPLYQPLRPGKAYVKDTSAPVLASGYPHVTKSAARGVEMNILVNDSPNPEVVRARIEYGLTSSYGSVIEDLRYFRRHRISMGELQGGATYHYRLILTDPVGNTLTTGDCTFATPAQTAYGGTPAAIPGTVQAELFDDGGEGIAYHDSDVVNNGNQIRTPETGVDMRWSSDPGGAPGFVGATAAGEWLEYTVTVAQTGLYTVEVRSGTFWGKGGTLHIEMDGASFTGPIALPETGADSWDTWVTTAVNGASLTAGTHVMRISLDTDGANGFAPLNYVKFTYESGGGNHAPVLGSVGDRVADEGHALSFTLTATDADGGDTLTYSATGLPAGAALDPDTGAFSWTPGFNQSGDHSVTFSVTDNNGADDRETIIITVRNDNDKDGTVDADDDDDDNDGTPDISDDDDDNDGLTDGEEATEGTDPSNSDTDEDGWTDGDEVNGGTDPLDPDSHPSGGGGGGGGGGGCESGPASGGTGTGGWAAPLLALAAMLAALRARRVRA